MDNCKCLGKKLLCWYMLKSPCRVDEVIDVIQIVKELCWKGGFNLTKFTCNKKEVLKSILVNCRQKNSTSEHLAFGHLFEDRTFGRKRDIQKDTLGFMLPCPKTHMQNVDFTNSKQYLWSPWFESTVLVERRTDYLTALQNQS